MDISRAFGATPHGFLLAKLKAYGINSRSCMLLKDYLGPYYMSRAGLVSWAIA